MKLRYLTALIRDAMESDDEIYRPTLHRIYPPSLFAWARQPHVTIEV